MAAASIAMLGCPEENLMERRRILSRSLVLVAAAMLITAACSDASKDSKVRTIQSVSDGGSFVGTVEGTHANIGLVTKDDWLAGFVCEGPNAAVRLDPVPIKGGGAKLVQDGRTVGLVAITDHGATGRIDLAGLQRTFAAEQATGKAGVYRLAAKAGREWDGWIVRNDGRYTGTIKSKPSISSRPWIDPDTDP